MILSRYDKEYKIITERSDVMKKRYIILTCTVLLILIAAVGWAMENKQIEQKAVLSGTVTSVISEGSSVKMGDSLVEISTLTGTTAASRATVNGVVSKVLVNIGDKIVPNQVVVYIE